MSRSQGAAGGPRSDCYALLTTNCSRSIRARRIEKRKGDERLAVLGQKAVERYAHGEFRKFGAHHPAAFALGSNSDFVHSGLARTKVDSDSPGLYTGCVRCINV